MSGPVARDPLPNEPEHRERWATRRCSLGNCIAVENRYGAYVRIFDTDDATNDAVFTFAEWDHFVEGVKVGRFDNLPEVGR